MLSEDRLSALLGTIYDAASDSRRWEPALCALADACGVPGAGLSRQGKTRDEASIFAPRLDPTWVEKYIAYYHGVNPIWHRVSHMPAGTVQTDSMVMSKNELVGTEFYNDFLRPQRHHSMLNAVLLLEEGRQTVVTLHHDRDFETEQIRLFKYIIPHVQRAAQLSAQCVQLEADRDASIEVLNRLDRGLLLLGQDSAVLFANRRAERLFMTDNGLRLERGILRAPSTADTRALHRVVAGCAVTGSAAGSGGMLALSRGSGRAPLSLLIAPLRREASWGVSMRAVAVAFIADPDERRKPSEAQLRQQFGLTAAESCFALEIMDGDGLQASADRLGVRLGTARTHLEHVFAKTDTRRQAELVRLLLASSHEVQTD